MNEIKEQRKQLGITTSELAEITGLNQATITQIENGKRKPSTKSIEIICQALGMSVPTIFKDNQLRKDKSKKIILLHNKKEIGKIYYQNNFPHNYAFNFVRNPQNKEDINGLLINTCVFQKIMGIIQKNQETSIDVKKDNDKWSLKT